MPVVLAPELEMSVNDERSASPKPRKRRRRSDEACCDLFAYIEGYYNRRRIRSALGYRTPEQAEMLAA